MNSYFNSYQVHIRLYRESVIKIGQLGSFSFPKGYYIYTGSAKKNILARVRYHASPKKNPRWHIDYLLNSENARIIEIHLHMIDECKLNKSTCGKAIIPGFGSSDCLLKCISHLKYCGDILKLNN